MNDYRIEAATKEEWAERALKAEARVKELEAELASGSFYQEKDIDAMQTRIAELEVVIKSLSRLDTQADLDAAKREARVKLAVEIVSMLTAMRGPVDVPRTERAVWVDEGIDRCIGEINDLIEAERGKP